MATVTRGNAEKQEPFPLLPSDTASECPEPIGPFLSAARPGLCLQWGHMHALCSSPSWAALAGCWAVWEAAGLVVTLLALSDSPEPAPQVPGFVVISSRSFRLLWETHVWWYRSGWGSGWGETLSPPSPCGSFDRLCSPAPLGMRPPALAPDDVSRRGPALVSRQERQIYDPTHGANGGRVSPSSQEVK